MNDPKNEVPPPKPVRVVELKTDPKVLVPFLLVVAGIAVAAAYHKISPELAGLLLAALGMPSVVGVKTLPQLVSAIVHELQRQGASAPPPSITSKVPPPPALPTSTETPNGLDTPAGEMPAASTTKPKGNLQ